MICNFLHYTRFFNLENGSPYLRHMDEMEEWEAMMELPLVRQPVGWPKHLSQRCGVQADLPLFQNRGLCVGINAARSVALSNWEGPSPDYPAAGVGGSQPLCWRSVSANNCPFCGGLSQSTVCRVANSVAEAICVHKAAHLKMPT